MKVTRLEFSLNYLILILLGAFAFLPFFVIVFNSVDSDGSAVPGFALPTSLTFQNFVAAWSVGHFNTYLVTSVIVTVAVVVFAQILLIPAAYAFARMKFRFSGVIFSILILGLIIPDEAIIIPLYYDFRGAGLLNTYASLILPQIGQSLAFGVFWMRSAFRTIPQGILDAAKVDGASTQRILWQIMVPLSRPAITTLSVLLAMWTWNAFIIPLVMVSGGTLRTVPLGLAFFQGAHTTNYTLLSAASILIAAPIVLLFLTLRRSFLQGMLGGALKA